MGIYKGILGATTKFLIFLSSFFVNLDKTYGKGALCMELALGIWGTPSEGLGWSGMMVIVRVKA